MEATQLCTNPQVFQKLLNICCFSGLESASASINQKKASDAIALRIEESLESEVVNRFFFSNAILKNEKKKKVTQKCIIDW